MSRERSIGVLDPNRVDKLLSEYRRHFLIVVFPAFPALIDFRSFQAIFNSVVPRTPCPINFCVPSFDRRPTAQLATTRGILQFVAVFKISIRFVSAPSASRPDSPRRELPENQRSRCFR